MGLGDCKDNAKALEAAVTELATIAGQKPLVTKAKKSVANFKVREGMNVGAKVTLRGDAHVRVRRQADQHRPAPRARLPRRFRPRPSTAAATTPWAFSEQLIFPEIEYDKVEKIRGMEMIFVTTAKTDEEAQELLRLLGMPFAQSLRKEDINVAKTSMIDQAAEGRRSSPPAPTPAAASAAVRTRCCASTASAASASANWPTRARSPACARPAGKPGRRKEVTQWLLTIPSRICSPASATP